VSIVALDKVLGDIVSLDYDYVIEGLTFLICVL